MFISDNWKAESEPTNFKMKIVHLSTLFLHLITNYSVFLDATTSASSTVGPIDLASLPASSANQQSVFTNCHAVRSVVDNHHEGKIGHWKVKCHVEVWNGKDKPALNGLSADESTRVMNEMNRKDYSSDEIAERSRYLAQQAEARHYICMEAKRTILNELKKLLPAGYNDCEKIKEVMNGLKLPVELETFINQVDGPMKDTVATIHSIEQDTSLSEAGKSEKLRDAKGRLVSLLDEACKDDHPSIRYHNIGYLPDKDFGKVKMTVVMAHPPSDGRHIEIIHLPYEGYSPYHGHLDVMKQMAYAAAKHCADKGEAGSFNVAMNANNPMVGDQQSIFSVTKDKGTKETTESTLKAEVKGSPAVQQSNKEASVTSPPGKETTKSTNTNITNEAGNSVPEPPKKVESDGSPIENYKSDVEAAYNARKDLIASYPGDTQIKSRAEKEYNENINKALNKYLTLENLKSAKPPVLEYSSTKGMWGKNYEDLLKDDDYNALPKDEKYPDMDIEQRYQRIKAVLKEAILYHEGKKSLYKQGKDKLSGRRSMLEEAYDTGKANITKEREDLHKIFADVKKKKKEAEKEEKQREKEEAEKNGTGKKSVMSTIGSMFSFSGSKKQPEVITNV